MKATNKILVVDFSSKITEISYFEVFVSKFKLLDSAYHVCSTDSPNVAPEMIGFIHSFIRKHRIKEKNTILSLSPSSIEIKYLDFPKLSKKEIFEAGKSELQDKVQFDLNDALIEWRIVKTYTDDNSIERVGVIFIIAERKLIDHYLALFKKCDLEIVELTSRSLCFANILEKLDGNPPILATLNIGYKDSNINLYVDNNLYFSRVIPIGIEKFFDQSNLEFSQDTVNQDPSLLFQNLMYNTRNLLGDGKGVAAHPHLEALVRQIRISFEYFQKMFGLNYPSLLYLTGLATLINGFCPFLRRKLALKAMNLPIPSSIEFNTPVHPICSNGGIPVINNTLGAVLRETNPINLIGVDIIKKKIESRVKSFLRLVAILIGVIIFILIFNEWVQLKYNQMRFAQKRNYYESITAIDKLRTQKDLHQKFVKAFQEGKEHPDGLLKIISSKIPSSLYFDSLQYDKSARQITLNGYFVKEKATGNSLNNFIEQMNTIPFLSQFEVLSQEDTDGKIKFRTVGTINKKLDTNEDS